jgi:hypothetical protein
MKLREFIVTEAIVPEIQATDRDGAIRELVSSLAGGGALASDAFAKSRAAVLFPLDQRGDDFIHGVARQRTTTGQ